MSFQQFQCVRMKAPKEDSLKDLSSPKGSNSYLESRQFDRGSKLCSQEGSWYVNSPVKEYHKATLSFDENHQEAVEELRYFLEDVLHDFDENMTPFSSSSVVSKSYQNNGHNLDQYRMMDGLISRDEPKSEINDSLIVRDLPFDRNKLTLNCDNYMNSHGAIDKKNSEHSTEDYDDVLSCDLECASTASTKVTENISKKKDTKNNVYHRGKTLFPPQDSTTILGSSHGLRRSITLENGWRKSERCLNRNDLVRGAVVTPTSSQNRSVRQYRRYDDTNHDESDKLHNDNIIRIYPTMSEDFLHDSRIAPHKENRDALGCSSYRTFGFSSSTVSSSTNLVSPVSLTNDDLDAEERDNVFFTTLETIEPILGDDDDDDDDLCNKSQVCTDSERMMLEIGEHHNAALMSLGECVPEPNVVITAAQHHIGANGRNGCGSPESATETAKEIPVMACGTPLVHPTLKKKHMYHEQPQTFCFMFGT